MTATSLTSRERAAFAPLAALVILMGGLMSCGTTRSARAPGDGAPQRAYLRVDVRPPNASIYVDEQYSGEIHRWREQTLVLTPGVRRVELRAQGYLSQRFDVALRADEMTVLKLRMEPALAEWSPSAATDPDDAGERPAPRKRSKP